MNKHKPESFTKYFVKHFYSKDGMARSNTIPGAWGSINGAELCFKNTCQNLITGIYDAEEESVALISQRWEPMWHQDHGWILHSEEKAIKNKVFNKQPV